MRTYYCLTCNEKYGMNYTVIGIKKKRSHEKRNKGHIMIKQPKIKYKIAEGP